MIKNFLFHRVHPQRDLLWDPMSPELFEKCIRFITKNYEVVLFEDIDFSNLSYKNRKLATIMFDDGYLDNLEYAAPILAKYNCKASFYVVTDSIDNNTLTWTHILEYIYQNTQIQNVNYTFDFLPKELQINKLKEFQDRIDYANKVKPFLKTISHEQRNEFLLFIQESYSDVQLPKLMMNWEQVRRLKNEGHYIGSHTVTHCSLGTMNNEDEIKHELIHSAKRIKEMLGYFPKTISYPVGSFNETTKQLSKQAGYTIGLAVKQNIFNPEKEDIFEVSRIELYNESWFKTRLRISHLLEKIKKVINKFK